MIKDHDGKEYKIVICTPAGREKYLSFFKKYIYAEMERGLVDGWQLWQNTVKPSDIAYLQSMAAENPKVKIYTIDKLEARYNNCDTLRSYEFFRNTHDDDTIYIRMDDDIVWYEPGAIQKIAQARIDHPDAFAIYPNVINSTIVSQWHQDVGALGKEAGECHRQYLDEFAYTDSKFIDLIHNTFKRRYAEGSLSAYYIPSRSMDDYQKFSICSIAWWGKDHVTPTELEEAQMSWELAEKFKRPNYFVGDALLVHYSYHTQIEYLESCHPPHLDFYKELSEKI